MNAALMRSALRSCGRSTLHLALSPWGYAKEIAVLGVLVWLVVVGVSTGVKAVSSSRESTLPETRAAVSRVLFNDREGLLCVFQNFTHVVAMDEVRGDVLYSHVVTDVHRLEFGLDDIGWSFLSLQGKNEITYVHSALGQIEIPLDVDQTDLKDISMSADGHTICGITNTERLLLWRIDPTGTVEHQEIQLPHYVERICVSPDGSRLAWKSQNNSLQFYDLATGQVSQREYLGSPIVCSAWSPDGKLFVVGLEHNRVMTFRATTAAELLQQIEVPMLPTGVAVANNGTVIASTSAASLHAFTDGEMLWSISSSPSVIRTLAFSSDNQQVMCGAVNGQLLKLSTATGRVIDTKVALLIK